MKVTEIATLKRLAAAGALVLLGYGQAAAQNRTSEIDALRSRQQLSDFEASLVRAISNGAQTVLTQLQAAMPERWRLTNPPRANGFRLSEFGVIVFVQVPDLVPPFDYQFRQIVQAPPRPTPLEVQRLRTQVSGMAPGPEKSYWEGVIRQMDQLELEQPVARPRTAAPGRDGVTAQSVLPPEAAGGRRSDSAVIEAPDESYTRAVKSALIDAMLKQTQVLSLGPDEKLTIYAHTSAVPDPLQPADATSVSGWVLQVKGSVLSAFRAGKVTEEEAMKLVEVTEQ